MHDLGALLSVRGGVDRDMLALVPILDDLHKLSFKIDYFMVVQRPRKNIVGLKL